MKNPRKSLFYFFLAYNLLLFLGSVYVDTKQEDLGFLLNVKSYIPWMKYFTFLGLVLFLVAYVVFTRDIRVISKEIKKSKEEHTQLKAKLFDLQEQSSVPATPPPAEPEPDDSEAPAS